MRAELWAQQGRCHQTERAVPSCSPASESARLGHGPGSWRGGTLGTGAGRGGGDCLALPPALLSRQLLVHGETFAAMWKVWGAVPRQKRHGKQKDKQTGGGDQTWVVA